MVFAQLARYWRAHQHAYLIRGLSSAQRMACVRSHYRFEESRYDGAYQHAVYRGAGLLLWQQQVGSSVFLIRLARVMGHRAQGEVAVSLLADGHLLHQLTFSWVEGTLIGAPLPLLPLVTQQPQFHSDAGIAEAAFARCFPNNAPSFFCFAALQGLVRVLGIGHVAGIKSHALTDAQQRPSGHPMAVCDGFWKALGGVELAGPIWLIALPFYLKPLSAMPSRHRKRAALRRDNWRAIAEATHATLQRHLLHAHRAAHPARQQTGPV